MPGFIYIHVPKCGGSSFGAALRLRFLTSQASISLNQGHPWSNGDQYIRSDYAARDAQLQRLMDRRVRLISGHVQCGPGLHRAQTQGYKFITILREPVERFVSHYNYLQRKHPSRTRPDNLEDFLDTQDAARIASQYVFYFGRTDQTLGSHTPQEVQCAITNLSQFALVGDLSKPTEFLLDLERIVGKKLPKWRRNKASEPTKVYPKLAHRIANLCAADIQIYNALQRHRRAA